MLMMIDDSFDTPTPPSRSPAFLFVLLLFIFLLMETELFSGRCFLLVTFLRSGFTASLVLALAVLEWDIFTLGILVVNKGTNEAVE